jgi:FdhD protein
MEQPINSRKILRFQRGRLQEEDDAIIREYSLNVRLNGFYIVTLLCSPLALEFLALGFLESEGIISSETPIFSVEYNDEARTVSIAAEVNEALLAASLVRKPVYTSGCGKGFTYNGAENSLGQRADDTSSITPRAIITATDLLQERSLIFAQTGAAHICLLLKKSEVVSCHEDIGRHNSLDKVFGECLQRRIGVVDGALVTSGRLTGEMVQKCSLRKVPIIISRSAATTQAIDMANASNITLIGFVRGQGFNVYTHAWRIDAPVVE